MKSQYHLPALLFWDFFGRHVHLVGFETSDILFVCMLKPVSHDISIDENEIQDAKVLTSPSLRSSRSGICEVILQSIFF